MVSLDCCGRRGEGGSNPARSVPTIVCRDWFCYPLCCFPSLPLSPSFLRCLGFVLCFYFFLSKCPQFEHLKSKQATFMPLTCAFSVSVCCTRTYVCVLCVCAPDCHLELELEILQHAFDISWVFLRLSHTVVTSSRGNPSAEKPVQAAAHFCSSLPPPPSHSSSSSSLCPFSRFSNHFCCLPTDRRRQRERERDTRDDAACVSVAMLLCPCPLQCCTASAELQTQHILQAFAPLCASFKAPKKKKKKCSWLPL